MKVVINDAESGASFQKEVEKNREGVFYGKKLGEEFDGGLVGLDGYKLKITGGSSKDGVPMRADVSGQRRTRALLAKGGTGVRFIGKGVKMKKAVFGNTVSQEIMQLNALITARGSKTLKELGFVSKKDAAAEAAKKEEAKKEEKPAPAEKPEAAKEKPKAEKKEEEKDEKKAEEKA